MRICIYGAGAIGGLLGARLARSGAEVSLIARGPHLAAMRERGLTLRSGEESFTVPVAATEQEIRGFASGRLADFKVPRKVVILEEIPKGATGKLQRIGLAQKLGLGA